MKLSQHLKKQQELFGLTDDLKLIYRLVDILKDISDGHVWQKDFMPLIKISFHKDIKTNKLHKIYKPSELFKQLLKIKELAEANEYIYENKGE